MGPLTDAPGCAHACGMDLSEQMKEARERKGLSIWMLAKHTGVSRATITAIEEGKSSPTVDTLNKLGEVLGLAVQMRKVKP